MENVTKNRAVRFTDGEYKLVETDVPKPGKGQVLIKVHYSTCNPIDKIWYYIQKTEGFTLGSDGSGVIQEVGEEVSQDLVGKKVAFLGGAWADYKVSDSGEYFVLDDSQDLVKAANAFVNPITVLGQLDIAKKKGTKAVVALAAASQLSKQFYRIAQQEGIEVINIVRRDEQAKTLQDELNAKYILNQTSPSFIDDLKTLVEQLNPLIVYEYVGGKVPGQIFEVLPPGSELIIVANLSNEPLEVNSGNILFQDKVIRGLILFKFIKTISADELNKYFQQISDDLRDGGKIFGTQIVKELDVSQFAQAIEEQPKLASEGKILIKL